MNVQKIQVLDQAVVKASKKIKVLNTLTWPAEAEEKFLEGWHKGKPKLPQIRIHPPDVRENIATLDAIVKKCDQADPVEKFLSETALSYANAGRMLMHVGTPDFTKYSSIIYGRPDRVYKLQNLTAVDGAKFFLDVTDQLLGHPNLQTKEATISASVFAASIKTAVDEFFVHDTVKIVLDPEMSSKALAGATRIRVREGALFSQLDRDQLINHEAFVHSATQLNGRKQIHLNSLGLGAPRTTKTQEGIAVMAELITNAIDISRLRRIALRVIAVQMALDGADFIDLFKYFPE
ncbi:MAG: DUF1704 domain-containing protein [Flavobacteriaceae bacterium]|nr:DUF1704 domain-containing protein [Flavobacteriaceae bacterium]